MQTGCHATQWQLLVDFSRSDNVHSFAEDHHLINPSGRFLTCCLASDTKTFHKACVRRLASTSHNES
eukprot:986857-Amphidinium_carterae.1